MPCSRPIVEQAVAIRMTCCNPDVTGRADRAPAVVATDTSARMLAAVRHEKALAVRAGDLGIGTVLYLPKKAGVAAVREALASTIRETRTIPAIVALKNEAVFLVGRSGVETRAMRDLLLGKQSVKEGARRGAGGRRLPGAVALITGGAQGFGKGIAEELLREGACVALADINEGAGRDASAELGGRFGEGNVRFVKADVTDAASMESCVNTVAGAFGGIDMLVANAGVLKAGALDEMDEADFDLVTRVNYRGYYVCVQAVAPLMKLQHAYNPRHSMDIVQVNSKSGLAGSHRNFAYAGSKFGGIGLTQSFALELVPWNIRVNAVCPGNYFDGPLWSDPHRGLFVQYLKTGKVPGAKTVADVRAHYMAKVPMGRGCLPRDVARAILYVHEQEYETGQALPVTGGQVMLS